MTSPQLHGQPALKRIATFAAVLLAGGPALADTIHQTLAASATPANWPMRQRDAANTGRADFSVPASRLDSNLFTAILWQKPTPGSPGDGSLGGSVMVFFDGAGPGGRTWWRAVITGPRGCRAWTGTPGAYFGMACLTAANLSAKTRRLFRRKVKHSTSSTMRQTTR